MFDDTEERDTQLAVKEFIKAMRIKNLTEAAMVDRDIVAGEKRSNILQKVMSKVRSTRWYIEPDGKHMNVIARRP